MSPVVIILHVISAVLGTWSATLLWRLVLERRERRRARPGVTPAIAFTPGQRLFGTIMAASCLPGSVIGTVIAEWISVAEGGRYGPRDVAAVAIAALMLMLAGGAGCAGLFFDPARGRRRCPSCWYQLAGIDLSRCPECGRDSLPENLLYRTRRSRGLLAMSLALLLVGGSFYFVRLAMGGKVANLIPTALMIVLLPSLPSSVVDGESGCLSERVEDDRLSPAQRKRLEKRCREVIGSSNDLELVVRVAPLHRHVANHADSTPRVTQQTALAILKPLFSNSREVAYRAHERWRMLERYLPDRLGPAEAGVLLPLVLAAMTSPDPAQRDVAYPVSRVLGKPGGALIPIALRVVRDRSRDLGDRAGAASVLAAQAAHSDEAWNALRDLVAGESELIQFVAGEGWLQMEPDYQLIRPKLLLALDDDTDQVVAWAARLILVMDPDHKKHLPGLTALMETRPGVTPLLLDVISQYLPPNQALAFAEALLNTSDSRSHDVAARVCIMYAAHAEHLLRKLRSIVNRPGRWGSAHVVEAISTIERFAELRRESEKDAPPE